MSAFALRLSKKLNSASVQPASAYLASAECDVEGKALVPSCSVVTDERPWTFSRWASNICTARGPSRRRPRTKP